VKEYSRKATYDRQAERLQEIEKVRGSSELGLFSCGTRIVVDPRWLRPGPQTARGEGG
jgi:hypothetical protein